mgnify:CR=1 FL=1
MARLIDLGVDGIILSNHGGRQLDRAPIPSHPLPQVVREVGKDATVMIDTGIMNGADIVASMALGAKFTPSWMDYPMFYRGNEVKLQPNMVFFAHMILMDSDSGNAMTLGRTYILTKDKPEPLSKYPLPMIIR